MAVNFSGKRKSEEDLLKKNGMTTTGASSYVQGLTGGQQVNDAVMRIAASQVSAGTPGTPQVNINPALMQYYQNLGASASGAASTTATVPSATYEAGGNTYHSREKKVGTGTAILDLSAGKNQQEAQLPAVMPEILPISGSYTPLPVDSGYTGAGQVAPFSSDWSSILYDLARQQMEINGQMPNGAPTGGGAYNDLYNQMLQQQISANSAAMQNVPTGIATGQGEWGSQYDQLIRQQIAANNGSMQSIPSGVASGSGEWQDAYSELIRQQMAANAAAMQNAPTGIATGQGEWGSQYDQLIRQQMAANAAAMQNAPTGIATGQGEWGSQYDQLIRQQMAANSAAMQNAPTGIATGQGEWADQYNQLAQEYMNLPEYQKPAQVAGADGQETWNDTLERLARQQVETNNYLPYDADTYDRMKATWLGKAEIAANVAAEQARQGAGGYGTSYASQLGANAYDASMQQSAADYYDQQKAAWERQRQINAQRLSIAGDMAARETDAQERANAEALAEWQRQRQVAAENMSIAGSMADREQSAADRQAKAELAAWERQQALAGQNLAYAGEMADREQSAADRQAQAELAAWERQRQLQNENAAWAGQMADREQSAADRQAQAELAAWERQRQLQNENAAWAGQMADREQSAADRQAQAELAAWERRQALAGQNLAYAGEMASREQSAADRQAQAELAAWERQQQLAAQNLSYAGEMASREQSAADRQAQAELAAWERQQALQNQNVAIAGEMADRETAAAQREYENRVNAWNMRRQANADNLSVAGDMAAWDIAQQQAAAEQAQTEADATYDRVQGLYQTLSQVYDGTNEATVRSQMRNAGYTDTEINNALNMVKNDMAAAVEDQARNYFGNQSAYDQMAQNNVISNEQAVAAKEMDSDNMTRALASAMSNPAKAAKVLGMDEATAAEFAAMDADSQMNWVVDTAGQMVLDHQINDLQFSQIIQPQVDTYLREIRSSKTYTRDVSDIAVTLKEYKDAGYLGSDAYGYMMQKLAGAVDASKMNDIETIPGNYSKAQISAYNDLMNYMSDEQKEKIKKSGGVAARMNNDMSVSTIKTGQ